jgi:hypothetical protein
MKKIISKDEWYPYLEFTDSKSLGDVDAEIPKKKVIWIENIIKNLKKCRNI